MSQEEEGGIDCEATKAPGRGWRHGLSAAVANGDTCRNKKPEDIHFSLPLNFKYFTRVLENAV